MTQQQQQVMTPGRRPRWQQYLADIMLAIVIVFPLIIFAIFLHPHISTTTILLVYLFVVFLLIHKRGLRAILITLSLCVAIDFFLIQPIFTFNVSHLEEALDLALFMGFACTLSYCYTRLQKRVKRAKEQEEAANLLYKEELRRKDEEVNQHERELHIFSETVQAAREEKDLAHQLNFIAGKIDEVFSEYGIHDCVLFFPDLEGKSPQRMLATQTCGGAILSREEESSLLWAIKYEKPVELADIPLISRPRGSYLRWNLPGCAAEACPVASSSSYIIPLLSRTKVVGGARFIVADNTQPRFTAFKKSLKTQQPGSSNAQSPSNLLLELLKHAVSLIEQALIEQALKDQERRDHELWQRTQELYNTIITSVHHDLKTPLTQIKAAASDLLNLEGIWQDEAERRSLLTEIINEVDEQTRTINRMLDLSRIEQGALEIGKELFPVEEIVRATVESRHIYALLQGRRLVRKGLEDLPPVDVDFVMIKQVLVNLIENAVRYTPAGSPIEIHGRSDSKQIYISVIDHGPGIPQAEQERVFEKFYRISKGVEDESGPLQRSSLTSPAHRTGLGLAVCRGFIEAHNGRIWVDSPDSGGARFQFTLPLRQKG